jgi:peptide/nickel transport system substrate-binding protein
MKKFLLSVICLALAVSVFAAPDKNNVVIGTNQEPDQLNPWEGGADTKENVTGLLFQGLTYYDSAGNLQPGLATEVPSEKNGRLRVVRDGAKFVRQEVDWTLRDNAKWSDGRDITSDDVSFTLEVQNNKFVPSLSRSVSGTITEIRAKDKKNFTIVYNAPNLFFAAPSGRIGLARHYDIAPKHIWEPIFRDAVKEAEANQAKAAEIMQQKFLGADASTGKNAAQVVGSGAFKFAEWQRNQFLRATRRADFHLAAPGDAKSYAQEVVYRFFTAGETALSALLAGELDATDDIVLAGQDPAVLAQRLGNNGSVDVSPSGFIELLNFNQYVRGRGDLPVCQTADDLLLGDVRTRQAIVQALDRDAVRTVFPGAIGSNSFVVRGDVGFNASLNQWPRNLENSKKLLADLGWTAGAGGVLQRRTSDGRTVFFRLPHVTTPATFRVRTQEIVQRQLRDVGISLEVSNQPASVLFSTQFVNGSNCNWGGIIEFASSGGIGESPADEISSHFWGDNPDTPAAFDNLARPSNGLSGENQTGYANPDFDKLFFQALSQFDTAARAQTVQQMQVIWNRDLPAIPLYERTEIIATKKGLVNYLKQTPLTRSFIWNAWEWGWEQNGAKKVR